MAGWYERNRHRYPADWPAIARAVKDAAGWRCEACGNPHGPPPYILTVDHVVDHDPSNVSPENLAARHLSTEPAQVAFEPAQVAFTVTHDQPGSYRLPPRPWPSRTVLRRERADDRVTTLPWRFDLSCGHSVYADDGRVRGVMGCPACGYYREATP